MGHLPEVIDRIKAVGWNHAPITDTSSTFGWVKWRKLCGKAGLKPIYGVELAVTESLNAKRPIVDHWTFIAIDSLAAVNKLVEIATNQFRYQPNLSLEQALEAEGVIKIIGHKTNLDAVAIQDNMFVGLGPSVSRGYFAKAKELGFQFIATSDNRYTNQGDRGFYEVVCGRNASTQSYPQWIMSDEEWLSAMSWTQEWAPVAMDNRERVLSLCTADLAPGQLLKPEHPMTLEQMCRVGAEKLNCDLTRPEYEERLKRELDLIAAKDFEDYFYIISDMCQWARERMIVGPARGSSCGSLVCYLLGITTVDPIPYGLIFERFIDINRNDLPDIDIDFSDTKRQLVFDYMAQKYGAERVARLGTVALYKPRSALQEAAAALDIPPWKINPVLDSIIERSGGDSRALQATEDTLNDTDAGRRLLAEFPEILMAGRMEGHPRHHSQHAAGIILTDRPVSDFVAVDMTKGSTHCDKKDAEELNLLKIDALGLTQLSVFEDTLKLANLPLNFLDTVPLDDQAAFDVLNKGHFSGVFQFNGLALQSVTQQIDVQDLEDIVSITALARPGPLNTGGTNHWIKVKTGREPVTYPHPLFEPHLSNTLGVVAYQEQVMTIGRDVGDLSWEDVTALRKAMSKSLGKEYFDQFGDKWKERAVEKGVPEYTATKVWDDLCAYGSWAFNRCIAGNTKLKLSAAGWHIPKDITIEEAYNYWFVNPSKWMKQNNSTPKLVSLFPDGRGRPQKSVTIHKNGRKHCFTYKFLDGSEVTCTKDHRFLINGEWQQAGAAKIGSRWTELVYEQQDDRNGRGKGHSKGKKYKVAQEGHHAGKDNIAWVNGASAISSRYKEEMKGKACQDCSNHHPRMEVHHEDFAHGKDRPDDLSWLCPSCHKKRHYANGRRKRFEKGYIKSTKMLVEIEDAGLVETYDIEMPDHHNYMLQNGLVTHNSHAVAYGLVSYYCCWLKAHYPMEFAAAALSHTDSFETQIKMLREMASEGVGYVPVDKDLSTDQWTVGLVDGEKKLIGPLSTVKGIGPKLMQQIVSSRVRGEPLPSRAEKLLNDPQTKLGSIWPITDRFRQLMPDPRERNISSTPVPIADVQTTGDEYEVMVFCTLAQIKPKDENEEINVAKRGYKVNGPSLALNLRLEDDTDAMFAKVDRFNFEKVGRPMIERGRAGKALYAIKGRVPKDFRMINVRMARYIGDMEKDD